MSSRPVLCIALAAIGALVLAASAGAATYNGRSCPEPKGAGPVDCRVAAHGTPDLSASGWNDIFGDDIALKAQIDNLAENPAAGHARNWALYDSLGQQMGELDYLGPNDFVLRGLAGDPHPVSIDPHTGLVAVYLRGHGCASDLHQQHDFPLVQIASPDPAASGGTQAFMPPEAFQASDSGRAALQAFANQKGGGPGCGPSGAPIGPVEHLGDPALPASAHAYTSSGETNYLAEYNAKPDFGNIVYFSTNTTQVTPAGGLARGMVRVGTPAAKVDRFGYCDPSSDHTVAWQYWAISTGNPTHDTLYGWIPAPCGGGALQPPPPSPPPPGNGGGTSVVPVHRGGILRFELACLPGPAPGCSSRITVTTHSRFRIGGHRHRVGARCPRGSSPRSSRPPCRAAAEARRAPPAPSPPAACHRRQHPHPPAPSPQRHPALANQRPALRHRGQRAARPAAIECPMPGERHETARRLSRALI